MAKDDYYTIAGKILTYLYCRLKKKTDKPIEYLAPNTKDFPIDEEYFQYVVKGLYEQEYIDGLLLVRTWDGEIINLGISENIMITPAGIDYLRENSGIKKALDLIPMAAQIAELFV